MYGFGSNYLGYLNDGGASAVNRPPTFTGDDAASRTRAWISRDQWNDYKNRFAPREDELLDKVTGAELLDERLSAISVNNKRAYESATLGAEMRRDRYGLNPSAMQRSAIDRNLHTNSVLTEIDSKNKTRQHIDDRNINVLGGGTARHAIGE